MIVRDHQRVERHYCPDHKNVEFVFPLLHETVPAVDRGRIKVEHFTVSEDDAKFHNLRCMINGDRWGTISPGTYTRLVIDGSTMMSDTDMELLSCSPIMCHATGDVLIGGLGLGLILHPILAKPEVKSVTVLELDPEVIALVTPWLPKDERLRIVQADVFTWKPPRGTRYDAIWLDIWPDRTVDNLDEMKRLRKVWAPRRRWPGAYLGCWYEPVLKALKRLGRWR